jgi:hypothetical protein
VTKDQPVAGALAVALALSAIPRLHAAGAAQDAGTPHLTILSANIAEESFAEHRPILERVATLTITVAGRPTCTSASPPLSYAFLIDRDRSTTTGAATRAFSELGIDAIVDIRCNPATGALSSTLGEVAVEAAEAGAASPAAHTIRLTTRVGALPSVDFHWIAMSREGRRFDRIPAAGRSGAWRTATLWIG